LTRNPVLVAAGAAVLFFFLFVLRRANGISMAFEGTPQTSDLATRAAVDRFNEAFNRHDADALAFVLTDDTVFEDTSPAPDGQRFEGKTAVVAFWRGWFARNPDAHFEAEEIVVSGDRAVVRWVYRKMRNGRPWHLRGVDLLITQVVCFRMRRRSGTKQEANAAPSMYPVQSSNHLDFRSRCLNRKSTINPRGP
jgi:ketosteroid isomerase-like protein